MPYKNIKIRKEYHKNYYNSNKSKFKESNSRTRNRYFNNLKELIIREKCRPCVDCKIQYNPWVMDFDHLEKFDKKFSIGQAGKTRISLKIIKEEILKCEVVCSNCHRERTHKRNQYTKIKEN